MPTKVATMGQPTVVEAFTIAIAEASTTSSIALAPNSTFEYQDPAVTTIA